MYKVTGSGSKRRRVATSESVYYYIPILSTLKQVLGRNDVLEHVTAPRSARGGMLQDFCDGQEYCEHPLFSNDPTALQIIAYYDDIEVCNPLGSSSKKHKLGIFLFTLGNLHPKFRSALKCIFLFAVAKTDDIRKYTPDAILSPFVSDINTLASTGVTITCSTDCTRTFKGTLLAFLADNLASHAIGGFKESFSMAYRFCRSCMTTHAQAKSHFLSHIFPQRTPLNHKRHCDLLTGPLGAHHSSTYGINRRSMLEDISNFSVVKNLPHDIMHDLLEGIVHDELTHLLNHCLSCKYFKLENVNERILSFDYGYSESSNKPAVIESVSALVIKLRQSASQMWLLSRTLPLLIGHFVPVDDNRWQCFGLLLTILDICTSHSLSTDSVAYLITLIEEHHTLFKEVYPHASVTPKMHFIVHYPEQILRFGPIIHSWTMRYESKLKLCKQAAKFGNFKNICFSVAQKHQRWLCYQLQASVYLSEVPEVGGQSTMLSFREESVAIKHLLDSIDISDDALICHPTWIKYFNCMYKVNCVLLLTCTHKELPVFGKVIDILVLPDSTVHFYVKSLVTEYFDDHYHAFVVKETLGGKVVSLASLEYPFVLHLYSNASKMDRNLYIVPKYGVYK